MSVQATYIYTVWRMYSKSIFFTSNLVDYDYSIFFFNDSYIDKWYSYSTGCSLIPYENIFS